MLLKSIKSNYMKIKGLVVLFLAALVGCSPSGSLIEIETPKRPAGQEDVIGLTADPIDTVRIGIVGIGMRGRGAVYRLSRVPGLRLSLCVTFTRRICLPVRSVWQKQEDLQQ